MKVLITGGSGYIGSHLAGTLGQAGHTIRVLDLAPASDEPLTVTGCDFFQGSVTDPRVIAQAVHGMDVIYHLAWGFHHGDELGEIQENMLGTLNLLKAALTAEVQHFLFASTAVVYGPTGPIQVDEEHPCHPEWSTIGGPVYGLTKLACEKLCFVYQRRGLPVTVFRVHGVFSQGRLGQFQPMIDRALAGEPVRAIWEAGGEYAHLEDILQAFLLAMQNPAAQGEIFNLAGTHTYRDPELARYIVEATGAQSQLELVQDPAQGMISVRVTKLRRFLGYSSEKVEFLTALIQNALPSRSLGAGM